MKNFFVVTLLVFLLTACLGNAPTQTELDTLGTVVAETLMAIPSATSTPEPIATEVVATITPEPNTVLPRSLYYLAADSSGKSQIYRLERDGVTLNQITFEQGDLTGFSISPVDGAVVYTMQNKLIIVDANGENGQTLIQESNVENLFNPLWSSDGKIIVYDSGKDTSAYLFDESKNEVLFPGSDAEDIYPVSFSPDGRKLLIRKHKIPSSPESPVLIYDFASQVLMPIVWHNQPYPCFGYISWDTSDNFFCYFHVLAGGVVPGLWRVNASDGSVESLVESFQPPFLLVHAPYKDITGNLYYLYGEDQGMAYSPLSLVRSGADGVTNREVLRPETFNVLNALWTPDGSALLISQNNGSNSLPANLVFVPVDPSLSVVTILADASTLNSDSLRWGP